MLIIIAIGMSSKISPASSDSGSLTGAYTPNPDLANISLNLSDAFGQVSNSTKDLHLEFFDAKNNTLIKNVSFFINATKDGKVLMNDLFYTKTGSMTIKFSPGNNTGKWTVNGGRDPILGGWMSENDILPITAPVFTEKGVYHIHFAVLALVYVNGLVDPSNPPTFDSWWSVDEKGNVSKYDNSTTTSFVPSTSIGIKNESPLKQFKSGTKANEVTCKQGLSLIFKSEDGSPACVNVDTIIPLTLRGWTSGSLDREMVYLMKSNSTAQIFVKFTSNHIDGPGPAQPISINPRFYAQGASPEYPTDAINATVTPHSVYLGSTMIVTYTITSQNTPSGIYWLSVVDPCGTIPIVVNLESSQVTSSYLQSPTAALNCPVPLLQYQIIGVTGATMEFVSDKSSQP